MKGKNQSPFRRALWVFYGLSNSKHGLITGGSNSARKVHVMSSVHRCSFVQYLPSAVQAIVFEHGAMNDHTRAAVARCEGHGARELRATEQPQR